MTKAVFVRDRLHAAVQHWRHTAHRNQMLRELLSSCLASSEQQRLQVAFGKWREYLTARVAKRMKQLTALLHWEHSLLRTALRQWMLRNDKWRLG